MNGTYKILDAEGNEINRIIADEAFVEAAYPGRWEYIGPVEQPIAPPPIKARLDTPLFMMRFTADERIALRQAAQEGIEGAPYLAPYLADLLAILMDPRLAYVEFDDPELVASIEMLVQLGLLTQARADIIMTP